MTIYTQAALTAKFNVCEGGTARTAAALSRLGLTMESPVTMQLILRELGLSDTVFSFCAVQKGCEEEARRVLWGYMLCLTGLACRFITLTHPEYIELIANANHVINKRCSGVNRKELMQQNYERVSAAHASEEAPNIRYFLDTYKHMLSTSPDYLAATHAGIALLEGCKVVGVYNEVHTKLVGELHTLLGVDSTYPAQYPEESNSHEL